MSPEQRSAEGATRLQPRREHLSCLAGPRRRSGPLSRPPARPRPAPLRPSPARPPVVPSARSLARLRPTGGCAPTTTADAGLQNSGPALCDTAHQSPTSAGGALQSTCEGRGRAFRGWRLLGCRGRTGVQEGVSVERGPDVDPLLLMRESTGARQGWRPAAVCGQERGPGRSALAGAHLRCFGSERAPGICCPLMAFPESGALKGRPG